MFKAHFWQGQENTVFAFLDLLHNRIVSIVHCKGKCWHYLVKLFIIYISVDSSCCEAKFTKSFGLRRGQQCEYSKRVWILTCSASNSLRGEMTTTILSLASSRRSSIPKGYSPADAENVCRGGGSKSVLSENFLQVCRVSRG
jgi:hypothetical protein